MVFARLYKEGWTQRERPRTLGRFRSPCKNFKCLTTVFAPCPPPSRCPPRRRNLHHPRLILVPVRTVLYRDRFPSVALHTVVSFAHPPALPLSPHVDPPRLDEIPDGTRNLPPSGAWSSPQIKVLDLPIPSLLLYRCSLPITYYPPVYSFQAVLPFHPPPPPPPCSLLLFAISPLQLLHCTLPPFAGASISPTGPIAPGTYWGLSLHSRASRPFFARLFPPTHVRAPPSIINTAASQTRPPPVPSCLALLTASAPPAGSIPQSPFPVSV